RAQDAEDLAAVDREREVVVRREVAESLGQVLDDDRGLAGRDALGRDHRVASTRTGALTTSVTSAVMPSLSRCSGFGTRAVTSNVRMSRRCAPQSLRVAKSPEGWMSVTTPGKIRLSNVYTLMSARSPGRTAPTRVSSTAACTLTVSVSAIATTGVPEVTISPGRWIRSETSPPSGVRRTA